MRDAVIVDIVRTPNGKGKLGGALSHLHPVDLLATTFGELHRSGLRTQDIDTFEVNEAFASVPLAWQREFDVPEEKLNPCGGAIALGHPLGASGIRIASTLIETLERHDRQLGLQTMCEAGGMANATIIERI